MKSSKAILLLTNLIIILNGCIEIEKDEFKNGKYTVFKAEPLKKLPTELAYTDTSYVAIYSDIYNQTTDFRINLTATLSLRNTSFKHSIYISKVDYYNSSGKLDKKFTKEPIELKPLQSVEYVIEEDNISGGTGANFLIEWSAKSNNLNPLFEAIMISTQNRQGISFTSRGVSVKKNN